MFICGSRSFGHEDEDQNESHSSPWSTPKRSKRSTSFSKFIGKDNSNKNPYAERGRDKFSALLADLNDKRQEIYTQMGSEDISFVQFVYSSDSKHIKPIVVKIKKKKKNQNFLEHPPNSNTITTNPAADASDKSVDPILQDGEMVISQEQKEEPTKRYQKWNSSFKLDNLRRSNYCFPAIVVLIMLFLAIYGRSFAILCTSIGWYLIPSIVGGSSLSSSSGRKPKRKVSKKNNIVHSDGPSSPKSVINGNTINQQQHGHGRSW